MLIERVRVPAASVPELMNATNDIKNIHLEGQDNLFIFQTSVEENSHLVSLMLQGNVCARVHPGIGYVHNHYSNR